MRGSSEWAPLVGGVVIALLPALLLQGLIPREGSIRWVIAVSCLLSLLLAGFLAMMVSYFRALASAG
jgi:hypothetical protein